MNILSIITATFLLFGNVLSFSLCRPQSAPCVVPCCAELSCATNLGWGRVKKGVTIDGLPIGGLPFHEAEQLLHDHLLQTLSPIVIHTPEGDVQFLDQLTISENAAYLVRKAKKNQSLSLSFARYWPEMESELLELCRRNSRKAIDAKMSFSSNGFVYVPEIPGRACDYQRLFSDVSNALCSKSAEATLSTREYSPKITEKLLRDRTRRLASFSTFFDPENLPRAHNIALAAARISGTTLAPQEEFSFNRAVGERTEKNGFQIASVIFDGEFVPGVGGGVCQVSTTLFNCALRAGLKITQSRPHSLAVSYVPPSLDAMVSSNSDFKFENPYSFPVYLLARVKDGAINFSIYGAPDGLRYVPESVVLSRISPAAPEIIAGEEDRVFRAEKEGILSESFLAVYSSDGKLLSRTKIRRDCYAAVRGKIMKKMTPPPDEANQNALSESQENAT